MSLDSEIAWTPDATTIERAQLTRFLRQTGHGSFAEMYRWSVHDIGSFTESVLQFLEIPFDRPWNKILDVSGGPEWARWCIGGQLNIADACLNPHLPDRLAVVWEGKDGATRSLSYRELGKQVRSFAAGLTSLGVERGDAVAIQLPMLPETVVALLACAYIGAIAVPLFSGYGPSAIEARIRDVEAKIVITADGFLRRGVPVLSIDAVAEAVSHCPTVKHTIIVPRLGVPSNGMLWDRVLSTNQQPSARNITGGSTPDPLHLRHHWASQGNSAFPLRISCEIGAGHVFWHRRGSEHPHLLDNRHWLDDGSVAHLWSSPAGRNRLFV